MLSISNKGERIEMELSLLFLMIRRTMIKYKIEATISEIGVFIFNLRIINLRNGSNNYVVYNNMNKNIHGMSAKKHYNKLLNNRRRICVCRSIFI